MITAYKVFKLTKLLDSEKDAFYGKTVLIGHKHLFLNLNILKL